MSKTREEKIRYLLQVAAGIKNPGTDGLPSVWLVSSKTGLYTTHEGERKIELTREQFDKYMSKYKGSTLIFIPCKDCPYIPVSPDELIPPDQDSGAKGLGFKPEYETVTTVTVVEVREQPVSNHEPIAKPEPVHVKPEIIIGTVKQNKAPINFEDIPWQDVPDSDRIDFMFGK